MNDIVAQLNNLRDVNRISSRQIIDNLFDNFLELKGDRISSDDQAIVTGIAKFKGMPVTIIGVQRDGDLKTRISRNFGAVRAAGFRKATRQIRLAEKFQRPIITIINMPGADASVEAENNNIALAISETMSTIGAARVPTISIIIGEAYSGGALSLINTDQVLMLSDALFNVASPEAIEMILNKTNAKESYSAVENQIQSAEELYKLGFVDQVIEQKDDLNMQNALIELALISALQVIDKADFSERITFRAQKLQQFLDKYSNI